MLKRRGLGQIEILVTAILVGTLTGLLSTMSYQLQRVHKEARQYQVATYEISSHLRRISQLPTERIHLELDQIQLSQTAQERLPSAKLFGRLIEESSGTRIELALQWDRLGSPEPLRMSAWLVPDNIASGLPVNSEPANESDLNSPEGASS